MARLVSVGFPLHPKLEIEVLEHGGRGSLDDADVVLLRIPRHPSTSREYRGRPSLGESKTGAYLPILAHWRRELEAATSDGKTVFIEGAAPSHFYYDTGKREHSGTGQNRQTTQIVNSATSLFLCLPYELPEVSAATGTRIVQPPASRILRRYWRRFGEFSRYEIKFEMDDDWSSLLVTGSGGRPVGIMSVGEGGSVFMLPRITVFTDYDWIETDKLEDDLEDNTTDVDEDDDEEDVVDDDTFLRFSADLVEELLAIDAEVRASTERTPAPAWLSRTEYQTESILAIQRETDRLEVEQKKVAARLVDLQDEQEGAIRTQDLIFEKGPRLERAVLHALAVMGIDAAPYRDGSSEFDSLFSIDGTRMLGEAEGRDKSPIAIDKITQLERNVGEDFARDDVELHAKGVLFGNPQRLTKPDERDHLFTEKCLASARRNKFALVLTADLFLPTRYLERIEDKTYARKCREAILGAEGEIVKFPSPPSTLKRTARAGVAKTRADSEERRAQRANGQRRGVGKLAPKR